MVCFHTLFSDRVLVSPSFFLVKVLRIVMAFSVFCLITVMLFGFHKYFLKSFLPLIQLFSILFVMFRLLILPYDKGFSIWNLLEVWCFCCFPLCLMLIKCAVYVNQQKVIAKFNYKHILYKRHVTPKLSTFVYIYLRIGSAILE